MNVIPARTLGNNRKQFIQKLLDAAGGRRTRARTAATFTLLKLCNCKGIVCHASHVTYSPTIVDSHLRTYVLQQGVLDILVKQLQFKDSALLAAYALTRCLPFGLSTLTLCASVGSSKRSIEIFWTQIDQDPVLAGYIVNMIRLDYFDDAVGVTEGFTIFEDLLRCGKADLFSTFLLYSGTSIDVLKRRILGYDIAALLERKLGVGNPGEMRTSLIYLNIFRQSMSGVLSSHVSVTKLI